MNLVLSAVLLLLICAAGWFVYRLAVFFVNYVNRTHT